MSSTIPRHPEVDPERERTPKPFNDGRSYSGEDYHIKDEVAMGRAHPSGEATTWTPGPTDPGATHHRRDIPPEVGKRAWSDPVTGEVHGSGTGDGGGAAGENYDDAPGDADSVAGGPGGRS